MNAPINAIASPINPAPARKLPEISGSLAVEPDDSFVQTPGVAEITERALTYLDANYPVHLSGPAGTGKTTLAFHVAAIRGRPVSLVHGNDAFGGSDLIGKDSGYKKSTVVDNFIHSVVKTQETLDVNWSDNRVTIACERGHTLIYDEFNRSKAEANNVLLSILEEGILSVPGRGAGYIRVHPEFRLLLTSNPDEYAGVHRTQDALSDRLITVRTGHYDADTESRIVENAAIVDEATAKSCVAIVRSLRGEHGNNPRPTIRAAIALARVTAHAGIGILADNEIFCQMAWDILGPDAEVALNRGNPISETVFREHLARVLETPAAHTRRRTSP
ncbi:MAG: gas vesicle protein GvpN [Planctomycetota bacterium]